MGTYLNPGNILFREALNSEIYVDKTELIQYTNRYLNTENKFICVSRPRRFGKSMALQLTFLIHLGYLAYDEEKEEVYIPNKEARIMMEKYC